MGDRIEKALRKLADKQRKELVSLIERIISGDLSSLDVKKLQGLPDVYRVRKGTFRVIFKMSGPDDIRIIALERRSETTYHF